MAYICQHGERRQAPVVYNITTVCMVLAFIIVDGSPWKSCPRGYTKPHLTRLRNDLLPTPPLSSSFNLIALPEGKRELFPFCSRQTPFFSERQMHVSRAALTKLEAALDTIRSQSDSPEWVRQIEIDALESQIEEIRADMTRYENLCAGRVDFPETCSLEELPTRLIEIRIASHLTQTDLAEKLGLKPQQIQRYEASRYSGASLARLTNVANALLHGKEMPIKLY